MCEHAADGRLRMDNEHVRYGTNQQQLIGNRQQLIGNQQQLIGNQQQLIGN